MSDALLNDIKTSILDMQTQMQSTYTKLAETKLIGESHDKTVRIIMTATYTFEDIEFDKEAFKGGIPEFKWRIREAWKNLIEKIQQATQSKTVELLQGMHIPEEIQQISMEEAEEDSEGSDGRVAGAITDDRSQDG